MSETYARCYALRANSVKASIARTTASSAAQKWRTAGYGPRNEAFNVMQVIHSYTGRYQRSAANERQPRSSTPIDAHKQNAAVVYTGSHCGVTVAAVVVGAVNAREWRNTGDCSV